jgi:chromosome segregation ATPase
VTEPNSIQSSWSVEDEMGLEWADPADQGAAKSFDVQLNLDLEATMTAFEAHYAPSRLPHIKQAPTCHDALFDPNRYGSFSTTPQTPVLEEIPFLRSQVQKQVNRIQSLERALDQSLLVIEELRQQLVNQQFLEDQLAATEEIANIQQQAITQLKQQLAQQQCRTENSMLGSDSGRDLPTIKAAVSTSGESPTSLAQNLADLTQQLENRQHIIEQLEIELDRAHLELQEQQVRITKLQSQAETEPLSHNSSLEQELFAAQYKIQELELQISKQVTTQAILQHTCHELEQGRDRYQTRAQELELQTADMQEQILQQAQQSSEHETAIQHWKDRYLHGQEYLKRISELVQHLEVHPTTELNNLLAEIQILLTAPEPEKPVLPLSRPNKMDIPDFLARHQRYRIRS